MITFPQAIPPQPPNNTKETYAQIESRILNTYENVDNLGICGDKVKSIYGISWGDTVNKPTIFLNACIHGNEWESTYWTLYFLDCLIDPKKSPPHLSKYFEYFRSNYSFYVKPIANPWGFEFGIRAGKDGTDYNRQYHTDTYTEVVATKNKVKEYKPVIFIDNHTSGYGHESIGVGGYGTDLRVIGKSIIDSLKVIRGHDSIGWYESGVQSDVSIGRGWVSNELSERGTNIISILIEGVFKEDSSLNTYDDKVRYGFNTLIVSCLYADKLLRLKAHGR